MSPIVGLSRLRSKGLDNIGEMKNILIPDVLPARIGVMLYEIGGVRCPQ